MAKTTASAERAASSKPKVAENGVRQARKAVAIEGAPAIEVALEAHHDRIRERAYGIWIAEGRPHGRDLAHWRRASHELLSEAR